MPAGRLLFSRSHSRRVAPASLLVVEPRPVSAAVPIRRAEREGKLYRTAADASENKPAVDASDIPIHLLRHAHHSLPPLVRTIMGLVLVPIDDARCQTAASTSSGSASSNPTAAVIKRSASAAASYRVGTPELDDEETADLRRRRIYALNELLSRRHEAQWHAYRGRRMKQMAALSKCALSGSSNVSRWGLRRFAECCARLRADEERDVAEAQRRKEEAQRREAEALKSCAARARRQEDDDDAVLAAEEMLLAMPLDPESEGGKVRYCPWHSTVDGCPLGACPFSHARLPIHLVTYKYRLWAFEVSQYGWVGEPINGPARYM